MIFRVPPKPQECTISSTTQTGRRPSIQTKELQDVSRRIGRLAVENYRQEGDFRVRQQETLRRALQDAAGALEWDVLAVQREDPIPEVTIDVERLTGAGIRALERDLDSEIAEKRNEMRQLERTIAILAGLAEKESAAFPAEVTYTYTYSQGKGVYMTKEEELLVEDPTSAVQAAKKLEKGLDRFRRRRDEMVERLKEKRKTVRRSKADVDDFVHGTHRLVAEVLATLH